ncbi:hypothetical protein NKJ28_00295 [Mesorhizobium sp. M0145]|uniref:hypothetical protein n=1 Tax=Mesorhizobium sp. M0145 TaxID=2956895 RepID=UPI003339A5C3
MTDYSHLSDAALVEMSKLVKCSLNSTYGNIPPLELPKHLECYSQIHAIRDEQNRRANLLTTYGGGK